VEKKMVFSPVSFFLSVCAMFALAGMFLLALAWPPYRRILGKELEFAIENGLDAACLEGDGE
jgi:hypothetical protein